MKKTTYLMIVLFAISISSCKKTYKCQCTSADSYGTTVSTRDISKTSKKNAEAICGSSTEVYTSSYYSASSTNNVQTTITNCDLK